MYYKILRKHLPLFLVEDKPLKARGSNVLVGIRLNCICFMALLMVGRFIMLHGAKYTPGIVAIKL